MPITPTAPRPNLLTAAVLLHATAHDRAAVPHKGRWIAAELAGEACDPGADLTMADRLALAALSLAVDIKASRRAGVEPCTAKAHAWLAEGLAEIERGALPIIPPAFAVGSSRGHRLAS